MNTLSSFLAKTNDASTSFIFNNSSAACAITIFILSVSVLVYAKHILLLMTFAFWIISALVIKSFISELNNFLTSIVSAPDFFKYDAASNVLTPVLNAKVFSDLN